MAAGLDMGKAVGPLPLGAWVVVVGGSLGYAYYRRRTTAAVAATTLPQTETGSGTNQSGVGASGFVNAQQIPVNSGTPITTNEEWATQSINYLIAKNYDPNLADSAIRNYLQSFQLSSTEYALVRVALEHFGSPPTPLPNAPGPPVVIPPPPIQTPPPPPPPPGPAPLPNPVALRFVIVQPWPSRLSTLSGIALAYYGRADAWHDIYNANRIGYTRPDGSPGFISNPSGNYLRPGDKLWVPGLGGPVT